MRDGWESLTLGEVAFIKQGQTLALKDMTGGDHPVFGANGIVGWHNMGHYDHHVVALGCRGSCGTVHRAPPGSYLANNVMAVWPMDEGISVDFLRLVLEVADLAAHGVISGQVQPQITRSSLAPLPLNVPPLAVQRRLVDLVDAVDTYAAAAKILASSSESLIEALESKIMDSGEHHRALGEVTQFAGGYAFSPNRQGNNEGEVPFYKVSDMNAPENRHTMTVSANYVSDEVLAEMRAKAWPAGTVVFPKVGAALLTEKRRVLGTRAAFDNNVMGLVPLPDIRPGFLLSYMRTVRLGDYAQPGAVPSVNQSHLRDLVIPVPPLEDQDDFISNVSAVRWILEAAKSEAEALSRLRSALLGELLSGEREIPASYDEQVGLVA